MPLWCVCYTATVVCMREWSIFYGCLTWRMRALVVHSIHISVGAFGVARLRLARPFLGATGCEASNKDWASRFFCMCKEERTSKQ